MRKGVISFAAILISCFFLIRTVTTDKFWKIDYVITGDQNGYYEYLPAVFIYNDLQLHFADSLLKGRAGIYVYEISPTEKRFIKYSCGVAYLNIPFFWGAHVYCLLSNQAANGFSDPYEIGSIISAIFYLIIGLFFLRKVLLNYFNDLTTACTLLLISIGTNLYYYATTQPLMAHVYSFCVGTAFLYYVIEWYKKGSLFNSIAVGICAGLLVLLRPVNILYLLVFLFFNITNVADIKTKVQLLISRKVAILSIICSAVLVWIPQLLYWHYVSGKWFYFSYGQETFYFSNPAIIKGLFGFRNGWLIYTPVMILALTGIYQLRKTVATFFVPLLLFTPLFIYIVLSWWCWWYVGFGNRAFIDAYPLFALPFACTINQLLAFRLLPKIILILTISFLVYLNLFQCWQMKYGLLHWDSMTPKAYKAIFLKEYLPQDFNDLLITPDYDGAKYRGKDR